ncbi:MAG: DUF177 domain-containing protein [bacterium]|nr:DUF177 domain-containing protein [bacterium]MDT8366158.1 DUF177 domain-containing protein [bacterium]
MLIHLEDILQEEMEIELELDSDDPAVQEMNILGPVKGSLQIKKIGQEVFVRGNVGGKVQLTCARCLKDFIAEIHEKVDIELRPVLDLDRTAHEKELGSDDLDVAFFRGDTLDIGHLAAEQISLSLPMKPLCQDDCRGICPECGTDKTLGTCGCEPETDPRWSALKDLKFQIDHKK